MLFIYGATLCKHYFSLSLESKENNVCLSNKGKSCDVHPRLFRHVNIECLQQRLYWLDAVQLRSLFPKSRHERTHVGTL